MKKLNNKGYMLVEIIIASVIAFSVGYYLINLTSKFMNMNEDTYYSDYMLSDKINITKNIMNDLEKHVITAVACSADNESVYFIVTTKDADNNVTNENYAIKKTVDANENKFIEYGKINENAFTSTITFDKSHNSYYVKKLDNYIEVGTPNCRITNNNKAATFNIPISNYYEDKTYGIKLMIETNQTVTQVNEAAGTL